MRAIRLFFFTHFLTLLMLLMLSACEPERTSKVTIYEAGEKIFEDYAVDGSFVLLNTIRGDTIIVNEEVANQGFLPASTFKIPNTIIGLETGVIPDINFQLKWDGVVSDFVPAWNKDHNLTSAMKNSVVWFYQEVARRVGPEKYKEYLDKFEYGNKDISIGVDKFWLSGGLRITPKEQVRFLSKLLNGDFAVKNRNIEILKKILPVSSADGITLYAKTGLTQQDDKKIGWLLGFIEKDKITHVFACVVIGPGELDWRQNPVFNARREVPLKILSSLGVVPDSIKFPG